MTATQTDWLTWRELHPDTLVIAKSKSPYSRNYSRDPYESYYCGGNAGIIGRTRADDRLFPKEFIVGLKRAGQAKAYPFSVLSQEEVVNDTFVDLPLLIVFDPERSGALCPSAAM